MQHFQSILIVVGLLAIGGVLIHGYLLSRKEKVERADTPENVDLFAEKVSPSLDDLPADDIISDVRIINHEAEHEEDNIDFSHAVNDEQVDPVTFSEQSDDPLESSESKVELFTAEETSEDTNNEFVKSATDDNNHDHFDDNNYANDDRNDENHNNDVADETIEADQPQDLFIFNVVAKEDTLLGGHELLQFFLTSGFRFGEMSIFHRHEHSDGTGPVLFSIASMMAPGTFDPENMEQFKSEGVSFFLTAPNQHIDIKASFEMMLRAVQQMADEFDCIVLNAAREPMTEAQFIDYNHRLLHHI